MQIEQAMSYLQLCKKNIDTFTAIQVSCSYCGADEGNILKKIGPYSIQCCSGCGFVYLNPRPSEEDLSAYYQEHYLPQDDNSIQAWKEMMRSVFSKAAEVIERTKPKGTLLDIGCGFGFFLQEMQYRGWEVTGIELSAPGISYARDVLCANVYQSSLEQTDFPNNCYDVITAFYVIEHSYDPIIFLKKIHSLLKPGGIVLLRYPHTRPLGCLLKSIRLQNNVYDIPFHLSDFSPLTIERFLLKAGFTNCEHFIGGYTLPEKLSDRLWSIICGTIAESLFFLSFQKYLMPGVSKNVIAQKQELIRNSAI